MIWFDLSRVCHAPQRSGDPSPNTLHQLLPGGRPTDTQQQQQRCRRAPKHCDQTHTICCNVCKMLHGVSVSGRI